MSTRLSNEERGWLIVEMMIGAVVLVIGGLAIYNGLDGASKASGKNRNRTEAAVVAQQDQERLRGMDASALTPYIHTPNVRTVNIGSNPTLHYTVTSRVSLANDNTGNTSCTSTSTLAQYLKISSTVTDPTGKNGPVTMDSLLSPRADQGGAAVQVVGRDGVTGVPGIPINLDEDASLNDTTDSSGCVQFGFLSGTSYHVSFSKQGYVDPSGTNAITSAPITVVDGRTTLTQFQYDLAGSITGAFQDGSGNAVTPISGTNSITVANNNMPNSPVSSDVGQSGVGSLFPFTDAYTVWAGPCGADNDPQQDGFSGTRGSATLTPGLNATAAVTMPLVQFSLNVSGGRIVITDSGCSYKYPAQILSGNAVTLPLPYGSYSVCADNGTRRTTQSFQNSSPTQSTVSLTIPSSGSRGTCS